MPRSGSFVHLHCHADGSMLDGLALVRDLVPEVERLGMPAIAITDHGSMAAAYDLHKATSGSPVRPIYGIEAYVSPGVPRDHRAPVRWGDGGGDDVSGNGAYTHMTLLAETNEGLKNLFAVSSESYLSGFYRKPRCDLDLLNEHSSGVIATTGCPSGEVQTLLRLGMYEKARESAHTLKDIFGADNFFVELMDHGLSIERRVQKDLIRLGRELGLPFLATNDLHYVREQDATAHEALLCLQSGSKLQDPNRFKFDANDFYLKTPQQMRNLWDEEVPDACDNTLLIAERCTATFAEGQNLMPQFPVPEGWTEETWFAKEVREGVKARYPGGVPEDRKKQTDYEIDVITQMGFAGYFLVVADFVRWAKDNGIRVGPGRGSAAGSIVAYGLGITELDPISNGLIFERFLNPERLSPPDIDIDFDEKRRGEVIAYVRERYGDDRVAHIGTFMQIKAKAAVKDAARVLGQPYSLGDKLTKAYPPPIVGRDLSLKGAYSPDNERYGEAAEFRKLVEREPGAKEVVALAKGLEGAKRGHGMHAAGVIMSSEPLINHVPLMKRDPDSPTMTQFEYPACESLGLIKMDFLGLSNLTTLDIALRLIHTTHGVNVSLDELWADMTDPATFNLLARGDTLGVFQLDSPPIRSLLRLMQPDTFNDISAVLALYRPGPMGAGAHLDYADRKNGRKPITPIHPALQEPLEKILSDTYGVIVFQEQVMEIAQKVAGYSLGQADLLRRAMGKKKKEILDKEFEPFQSAALANGYSPDAIKALWDVLVPFSDYAFNRAHSAAYGYISYATAYLKANYPAEYMAALLTTNASDRDKTALYLGECRRMGLRVLPPDINASEEFYNVEDGALRVGFTSLKNIGAKATEALLQERSMHGKFTSFEDFLLRCPKDMLRKRNIEALIKAGSFDSFGHSRAALMDCHEQAVDAVGAYRKSAPEESAGLFDIADAGGFSFTITDRPEWDTRTLLGFEREFVGLYVSSHPLEGAEYLLRQVAPATIAEVQHTGASNGSKVDVAGLVTGVQQKTTRKGDPYAIVTIEDLTGTMNVMVFPRIWQENHSSITLDGVVHVSGRVDRKDDGSVAVMPDSVSAVDMQILADPASRPFEIHVPEHRVTPELMGAIKTVLSQHAGPTPVHLRVQETERARIFAAGDQWRVARSAALVSEMKAVAGVDCLPHENVRGIQ